MAKDILTFSSPSSNLVPQLAYLINTALQERCGFSSDSHADYHRALATLMGLGFTAILAEGNDVWPCRRYVAKFLRYRNFPHHVTKLEPFSHAIAQITCRAIRPFHVLGHPLFHDDFIAALIQTLKTSDTCSPKTDKMMKKMLQELFEKYS